MNIFSFPELKHHPRAYYLFNHHFISFAPRILSTGIGNEVKEKSVEILVTS